MRLLRSSLAVFHARRALHLQRRSNAHADRAKALILRAKARHPLLPAERLLLASMAGLAICLMWIAMTWGAWG